MIQLGIIESLDQIQTAAKTAQDKLTAAGKAVQKESEDKSFWGSLVTMGTTLGCAAFGPLSVGACAVAGAVTGGVTKMGIDLFGDSEADVRSFNVKPPETKYYRAQGAEMADKLNENAEYLKDYIDNEWKVDLLSTVQDAVSSFQLTSGLDSALKGGIKAAGSSIIGADQTGDELLSLASGDELISLSADELNLIGTGTTPTGPSNIPDLELLYMAEPPAQAYPVSIPGTGTRTPFVGSGGTAYDQTSAWESVGETFPVSSPDLVGNIGEGYSKSVPYDYQSIASKRHQDMAESLRLMNLLWD